MRRTYRSKKETGGLDPRDMIQNMDEKSSKFDAFYIQNIKRTKRELSCLGISDQHPVSNRVRKIKFVKRIKESEVTQASTPPTTFLTPDKSLRVNKVKDIFDQLVNSCAVHNSPETSYLQQNSKKKIRKTYKIRNRHLPSTDSSGSDKENVVGNKNQSPNESDLKLHDLLLEKQLRSPTQLEDSIEDVKNNLPLFIKLQCQQNLLTPKQKLSQMRYLDLSKSPLCSTPFHEKYRGQSIYKYSPISVDIENEAKFETIAEAINTHDTYSSKKQNDIKLNESLDYDDAPHFLETVKEQETYSYSKQINNSLEIIDNNTIESEDIDLETNSIQNTRKNNGANIKETSISKDISDVQDATTHNADMFDNNNQSLEASTIQVPDRQSIVQDTSIILQTSECTKFLGFSKGNGNTEDTLNKYRDLNNKLIDECSMTFTDNELASEPFIDYNNGSINSDHHNKSDILDMPSEPFMHCTYINSSLNSDANDLFKPKTSLDLDGSYKVESISLYDTCSENESMESSKTISTREPKVRIERLNKSVFQKYKQLLCNTESDLSVISDSSVSYESFDNISVSVDNEESSDDGSDQSKIEPIGFVSTRRGNEITNNSFLINLDSSSSSVCSLEVDKTVVNNDEKEEKNDHKRDIIHIDKIMQNINETIQTTNITLRQSRRTKKSPGLTDQTICHKHVDKDTEMSQNGLPINDTDAEIQSKTNQQDVSTEFDENNQSIISQYTDFELTLIDNNDKLIPLNTTVKQSRKTNNSPEIIRESMNGIEAKSFETVRQSQRIQQSVSAISKEPVIKSHNPIRRPSIMIRHSSRLSQNTEIETDSFNNSDVQNPIVLQPGKRWERSLSIYRRMTTMVDGSDISMLDVESLEHKGRRYRQSVITTMEIQGLNTSLHNESIKSRRSTFVSQPISSTIRLTKDYNLSQTSIRSSTIIDDLHGFLTEDCDDTVVNLSKLSLGDPEVDVRILESFHDTSNRLSTARDYVLRRCNQTDALLFDECYPDTSLKNCRKIGEGVYGEVFLWRAGDGRARVLKVIPVAGDIVVNGEKQKDYHQIISEIVIAMELSALGTPIPEIESRFDEGKNSQFLDLHSVENATDVFNKVLAVRLVYGSYPSRLLDLWDLYDECKGSENDNPAILPSDQHYIVLELANAGQDLESYQFNNAEQAYALFQQVAFGLAVAEEALQFEHRDLHWGNVLIAPTDQKYATFVLRGRARRVRTCGVKATVIDYSLSRVSLGARVLCCDLAEDESLFDALGDYQFEVYRRMRDRLGNEWKNYDPHTNILWLHYTADKMITALRYTRTNTKIHKHYIAKLKDVKNRILYHGSACEYVITDNEI